MWNAIAAYDKVDDYTVHIKLKAKDVEYLTKLATSYCGIVSEKAVTANQVNGYMMGTGAYKVAEFSSLDHVTFERNENYWGEKPMTKTQIWRIVPEANTRTIMLQNGEADAILAAISESDIELFMASPEKFEIIDLPRAGGPNALQFNMTDEKGICTDYNFRSACIHAIDREEVALISQGIYAYEPETEGSMWGFFMPYRNKNIPYLGQDIELAKEYLAKSSYKGEEVTILTANYPSTDYPKAAEVIQQQLNAIGVNTRIVITDNAGLQAACQPEVRYRNQIIIWTQTLNQRVSSYKTSFYTGAVRNRQSFSDPELDALLDKDLETEFGPEKEAIAMRMQEIVSNSRCTVNLFWALQKQAAVKGFGGIQFSFVGTDYRYIHKPK
jgi:peptide/nickel transport system substrate-binding protein